MADPRFYLGAAIGLAAVLILASLVNELGDVMFRRGFAKPFYVKGHRIHHRDVLFILFPAAYTMIVSLILLGFIHVIWGTFWTGIETTLLITAGCFVLDFALDGVSFGTMREKAILHHEWVYLLIPAYVFTHVLAVLA